MKTLPISILILAVAQLVFAAPRAFAAGLIGSFVGGLLVSLLSGDGLALRPSGIIGSLVGAIIVTVIWQSMDARKNTAA